VRPRFRDPPAKIAAHTPHHRRRMSRHHGPMPNDGRVTADIRTFPDHRRPEGELDRLIVAIAQRQHGVIALLQLLSLGLSSRAIRGRVAAGRLHRLHRGVYAVGRPDVTIKGHWNAAVLACGEGAVLSHRSAATLHGLMDARGGRIEVTVPCRSAIARPRIRVHRSTCLVLADRMTVDRIPCTSVPATLLALAATSPQNVLESACNKAEIKRVLDMRSVSELLARRSGHPGASRLRAVLAIDDLGTDRTKSKLEKRFLKLAQETGMPRPTVNEWISIPGEEMQCDFVWHREKVIVEVDGWETHRTRHAFQDDRRRDRLLRLAGWDVLRFTHLDVERDPDHVTGVVHAILKRRTAAEDVVRVGGD
jgi:predicted transcriptional regulator of viral defense system